MNITTTLPALDLFLIGGLIVAFVVLLITDRHTRARDKEMMDVMRRVDLLLYTWATHWGAPTDEVKMALLEGLRKNEIKYGRRKDD